MTEPKKEGRLERLERMIADALLTVRTLKDAFEQDRAHARRERQELRGKVEKVIHKQNKSDDSISRIEADVKEVGVKVDSGAADISTLTANQSVLRADVGEVTKDVREMRPFFEKETIKQHEDAGARKLWKKQWAVVVIAAGIIVWLIGEVRDWWPKMFGK